MWISETFKHALSGSELGCAEKVAPYTSSVKFDLIAPSGKQSLKHASPQVRSSLSLILCLFSAWLALMFLYRPLVDPFVLFLGCAFPLPSVSFAVHHIFIFLPYTSTNHAALHNPPQNSLTYVYARFGAYPTSTEFDASTAVGGLAWRPTVSVSLPKSGTWYVCAHVQRLVHVPQIDVAISVAAQVHVRSLALALPCLSARASDRLILPHLSARDRLIPPHVGARDRLILARDQVLPHTECVEHTLVAKDGQSVKHVTQCTDEITKLEIHYHSSPRYPDPPPLEPQVPSCCVWLRVCF
eukprot:3204611-Rhodomonas_salina.1